MAAPGLASDAHLRVAGGSAGANVPALQRMLGHDAVAVAVHACHSCPM